MPSPHTIRRILPTLTPSLLGVHPLHRPSLITICGPVRTPPPKYKDVRGLVYDVEHHRFVQRLGHVTQLGTLPYLCPMRGCAYSRLEHSTGVSDLAYKLGMLLLRATNHLQDGDPRKVLGYDVFVMEVAAFLHDVGHGPLSHQFDAYLARLATQMSVPAFPHPDERGVRLALLILQDCWAQSDSWKRAFPIGVDQLHAHVRALILAIPHPDLPPMIRHTINANSVHHMDLDRLEYLPRDAALILSSDLTKEEEEEVYREWLAVSNAALTGCHVTDDFQDVVMEPSATTRLLQLRSDLYTKCYSRTADHSLKFDQCMQEMVEKKQIPLRCLHITCRSDAELFTTLFPEHELLRMFTFL